MRNHTDKTFGFDASLNREMEVDNYSPRMATELVALQKRVKKSHPFAKFRHTADDALAIRLSPQSMCFRCQGIVGQGRLHSYDCKHQPRALLSYADSKKYNIDCSARHFTSPNQTLARATKLVKDTRSITGERVLEKAIEGTIGPLWSRS